MVLRSSGKLALLENSRVPQHHLLDGHFVFRKGPWLAREEPFGAIKTPGRWLSYTRSVDGSLTQTTRRLDAGGCSFVLTRTDSGEEAKPFDLQRLEERPSVSHRNKCTLRLRPPSHEVF